MLVQRVAVSRRRCRWRGSGRRRGGKKEALCKTEIRRDDPALHWSACDVVGTPQHVMFASPSWNKVNWRTNLASQLEKRNAEEKGSPYFFSFTCKWFVHCRANVFQPGGGGGKMIIWDHTGHFFFLQSLIADSCEPSVRGTLLESLLVFVLVLLCYCLVSCRFYC